MITSRPFFCFILLALIGLLLSTSFIPFGVSKIKQVEKQVDVITKKSHQEIWSVIQNAATTTLLPMKSSATNLAKVANMSLTETDITFYDIQAKVAPLLFQAMVTIPHLSQISYIRQDGLFFALYSKDHHQIVAIYSNTSFSKATRSRFHYLWYTQPVNSDTGKLYGDAVVFPPQLLINETWLQQALNTRNGFASLGKSLNDVNNLLVLNTAGVDKNGVISLGFELKSLINVFSSVKPLGGGLYLATRDGKVLTEGIPNTRMVLNGNGTFSFMLWKADGYQSGSITLQLNYETPQAYTLDIPGTKYTLYSSSVDIIGMQLVYVLALPYEGLPSRMHKNIIFVFALLSATFVIVAISIFSFVVLTVRASRKEMCLRAALIKQKEATQQAERKSKNHSLAFVSASHDIRASLAGIAGLLDLSISNVQQGSELAVHMGLMQKCTRDLKSILNSILDTSKIEAGKMQLEEKQFDLANALESVVDLFYPVGLKKEVDVILDLQDGSLTKFSLVKGDERKFKQILANLLSNAIKFTSEGYVSVRAWVRKPRLQNSTFDSSHNQSRRCLSCFFSNNDEVHGDLEAIDEVRHDPNFMEFVFEVDDTGKGIPKEKQASIFENYVQVKETGPQLEGTGLGLGIVRSLVQLMGGEISIVDKEVGEKGTCFRFNAILKVCQSGLISLSEDEKTVSPGDLSAGSNTPLHHPRQLDHNSSIVVLFMTGDGRRKMAQNSLAAQGIKVVAVKNTRQLSETLREFRREEKNDCSSKSDLNLSFGYLTWPTSRDSNTRSREVPLSSLDGTDMSPIRTTNTVSLSNFILLVIDTTKADFRELCRTTAEFRKYSKNGNSRVVWLGSRCIQLQGLDEKKLPPSDIIIPMPLHGSRLYSLIGLLPEFGGKFSSPPNQRQAGTKEENHHPPSRQLEVQEIARISPSSSSPLRGKRVLLAEDDAVQQTIAKKILLKHGVTIETCRNGKEALTMVSKGLSDQRNLGASHILPYEYILMDYQMPVMDGCEATRQIRLKEKDYGVHAPIIGLTAHTEGEELNKLFVAGIDIHVSKPLNEQKVLKVIEDLHSRK
ncbi:CheY-like superfamily [Cynara cardunculus var. scolymus]|uniref:histidine kinase n=1 Tax=Cynara cardunculus var. scolymus TaxID=59895 RepID=A0A118JWM7_CYNCS|nr:CheY-like superfamily [Cynara cardunculus var. scolymus]